MYENGKGNVTLSARHGAGQFEPEVDHSANITLLEGSGVKGNMMVANVLCSNCHQWNGGSTDFSSGNGDWIHASLPGRPLDSTDLNAQIQQHENYGSFTWTYTTAQGGQNINPFVAKDAGSTGVSSAPQPNGGSVSSSSTGDVGQPSNTIVTTHGTIASISFLVLFPVGGIVVRVLSLPIWVHAGLQILSYVCFVAAAGLGIYIASVENAFITSHAIIGIILLGLLTFQPFFGVAHHRVYRKIRRRTWSSYFHIWEGRIIILLGMINGGLGIRLAGGLSTGYITAYGVVAGVMGLAYLAAIVFGEVKRRRGVEVVADQEAK